MRKCMLLGGLAAVVSLFAAEAAQAQFGFSSGRGWRGGRSYGVETPIGSAYYGRGGRGYGGYGYDRYGSGYGGYGRGGYGYRSGWSIGTDGGYYAPGYSYSPGWSSSSGYVMSEPAPARSSSQAFYSGTNAEPNQATIRVMVPDANAEVWFESTQTKQKGTDRVFVSPSLEEGRTYTYQIKATWQENGREVTRQKDVDVQPGSQAVVNFSEGTNEEGIRSRRGNVEFRDRDSEPRNRERENIDISRERIGRDEPKSSAHSHMGIVVRAANGEFVMRQEGSNDEHNHRLAPDAQILVNGKKAALEDLKAGMHIEVTTKEGDKKIATKIEAKSEGKSGAQPPP